MTAMFIIGLILIGIFGYASGAYITIYKLEFRSNIAKGVSFVTLGTVISFVTFFVSLAIIWPGVM
ncbi:MAG: hypothetical protein M0Z31_14920 [Clostridia bacterium]|nr:hypothetical protein [Clostridia bacterium]